MVPTILVPEVQILVRSVISDSNIQNHHYLIERITACMQIIYCAKMTDLVSKMTDDYVLSLGGTKWLVPPNPHQNLTWIWYTISKSWFWRSHFEMTGLSQKWQLRLRSEPRRAKWLLPLNPHQKFTCNRYQGIFKGYPWFGPAETGSGVICTDLALIWPLEEVGAGFGWCGGGAKRSRSEAEVERVEPEHHPKPAETSGGGQISPPDPYQ